MVLGHPDLGYTGQPDKVWLVMNKEKTGFRYGNYGLENQQTKKL